MTLSIDWAVVHTPQPGQTESGDNFVIATTPDQHFMSVIDGLGHGPKASTAAHTAVNAFQHNPFEPAETLMKRTHKSMLGTRGAVITVAHLERATGDMTWMGVGNVNAVVVRADGANRDYLLLRGGIVGYRMPPMRTFNTRVQPGDTLVMVTDGIRSGFIEDIPEAASPLAVARYIHKTFNRETDDSLVMICRFIEGTNPTPAESGTLADMPESLLLSE